MKSDSQYILPRHIAIIMDGNGRWAEQRGLPALSGHQKGVDTVRAILEDSVALGVKFVTLYAFSSENWKRPQEEVDGLMLLFSELLKKELETFMKQGIRLRAIGDRSRLPERVVEELHHVENVTAENTQLTLVLAVSYGGRDELVRACHKIAEEARANDNLKVTEELISKHLDTSDIPDPDLLIRTSGEFRISNFLLWQLAYTEIVVTETLWPDFTAEDYRECIAEFGNRDRRYGAREASSEEDAA